jgi:hypothetical protein
MHEHMRSELTSEEMHAAGLLVMDTGSTVSPFAVFRPVDHLGVARPPSSTRRYGTCTTKPRTTATRRTPCLRR